MTTAGADVVVARHRDGPSRNAFARGHGAHANAYPAHNVKARSSSCGYDVAIVTS